MPSKFSRPVAAGDRFYHRTAGAGGWGDPLDREPEAVAVDVGNGILSPEAARARYGVVVTTGGTDVDTVATARERDARRSEQGAPPPAGRPTPLDERRNPGTA